MLILGSKMTNLLNLGLTRIYIINHTLLSIIRYNFQKTLWAYLEKSSKMLILGPKMSHLLDPTLDITFIWTEYSLEVQNS